MKCNQITCTRVNHENKNNKNVEADKLRKFNKMLRLIYQVTPLYVSENSYNVTFLEHLKLPSIKSFFMNNSNK